MCERCLALQIEEENAPRTYTVYTTDGKRLIVDGLTFAEGWHKVMAEQEQPLSMADISWIDKGITDSHYWMPETQTWMNRKARELSVMMALKEARQHHLH